MLLLSLSILSLAYADKYEDIQTGKWNKPPIIQICNDAKIKKLTVNKAIRFWKKEGFEVKKIIKGGTCSGKIKIGYIQIMGERNLNTIEYNGSTQNTGYYEEGSFGVMTLEYSRILLRDDYANNKKTVIHEVGHALGLEHSEKKTNIMYAYQND